MGINLVLLAYKEEENLRVLLPVIKQQLEKINEEYEILVIDTAQPFDNTKEVCRQFGVRYINQEEPFFGGAFRTAIKYASKDKFMIMDSDGAHDPERIPALYEKFMEGNDVVIGSRYAKGGKTNDALSSIIMSKTLNGIFRLFLGIKAKDISTDFRIYYTEQLKQLTLTCNNYDILQEVLLKLKLNKPDFKIDEVPISFNKRIYGESKRNLLPFINSYIKTLTNLTLMRIYTKNRIINKIMSKLKQNEKIYMLFKNYFWYGIIGLFAAVVDFSTFTIFNAMTARAIPEIGNLAGNFLGFLFSFSLNTYFNFKKTNKLVLRFLSYFSICVVFALLSSYAISLLKDSMNLSLLKILCLIVSSTCQFLLNKLITFKK